MEDPDCAVSAGGLEVSPNELLCAREHSREEENMLYNFVNLVEKSSLGCRLVTFFNESFLNRKEK